MYTLSQRQVEQGATPSTEPMYDEPMYDEPMYEYGAILQRPLAGHLGKLYKHVGIYIGRDRIIHFNGTRPGDRNNAAIRIDTLDKFAGGHPVSVRLQPQSRQHGRNIVRTAQKLKFQQDNPYNYRYDFVFRNCEDFCRHCYRDALAAIPEPSSPLPPSQRGLALIRLTRAVSLGYLGARLGRLAGPYGAIAGALAGIMTGALMSPHSGQEHQDEIPSALAQTPPPDDQC